MYYVGFVERKHRSFEELARTLLNDSKIPKYVWADVVNTTCYVLNRALIRPIFFFKKRLPMSFIKEENQILVILKCFVGNILF